MKYLIVNDKQTAKNIIEFLIDYDKLPKIQSRMNIYAEDDSFQIEIVDNMICYRKGSRTKSIYVKNKNFKYFLKNLDNTKRYFINSIEMLKFSKCSILFDTYHGTIIDSEYDELIDLLKNNFDLSQYDNINDHEVISKLEPEYLFDEIGNLNNKIKKYGIKVGLDIRSSSSSLRMRISSMSNDYSYLENYYKFITNNELLSLNNEDKNKYKIDGMSIIIPVYNTNVAYSLLSIQGQNLNEEEMKKLQVIVINDGSSNDVYKEIEEVKKYITYELEYISFGKNNGLSSARNAGYALSKYDKVLFMDSDIILSKDYIYDMNIRMQLMPRAIFTCMRKNISKTSDLLNVDKLLEGIPTCTDFDDSRVMTKGKEYHIGADDAYIGEEISILDDTDCFKELSFGSQIDIYNLSTVVAGHNININKTMINTAMPFSNKFKGWGMEDAYFSANLIAEGCYVIPVLSSCVYHIDHEPRSGSMNQKVKEAETNYKIYNDLLNQVWNG